MRHPFLQTLDSRVLLCDGAMGTLLRDRGVPLDASLESLNLEDPAMLLAVHRDYIAAGADIIETNTFGANKHRLARFGLEGQLKEVNQKAVQTARKATKEVSRPVFVAGAMGPLDVGLAGGEEITLKAAYRAFREQAETLIDAGADLIITETLPTLAEAKEAIRAIRDCGNIPAVVQLTFQRDGRTWAGEEPGDVALTLRNLGADVVGVNCVAGPSVAFEIIKRMGSATPMPLSAQPNAGQPQLRAQGLIYPATPEQFREFTTRLVQVGASIIGGCCGTTPTHIAAMHSALVGEEAPVAVATAKPPRPILVERAAEAGPEPETLREKLASKQFVVTVEVDPPRGLNAKRQLEGAKLLKEVGVDCINVGDSPMARLHMSAIVMAIMIEQQVGAETIVHVVTRDRNLMALEADLIGAHVMGVRNVLCLKGDPPRGTGYSRAIGVWDVTPVGLVRILKGLNEGVDPAGTSIGQPTSFFIGAAANPTGAVDVEKKLMRRKLEAGADFVVTQPVYDAAVVDAYVEAMAKIEIPIILGVMPLHSYRHAEFIHHELGGVTIPDEVRERMRLAGDKGLAEGLKITRELLEQVRHKVAGVCVMPSFNRFDVAAELVASIRD